MYLDIFLGIFLFIGLVQGYHKGIIRTVFALLSLVVGILAVLKFSPIVVSLFDRIFHWDEIISLVLGVALTFILIMWGIRWLGRSAEKTLKLARLNFINKFFGAVLYAGIMLLTFSAVLWFLDRTDFISENQKRESKSYEYVELVTVYSSRAFESVKPVFQDFWDRMDTVITSE